MIRTSPRFERTNEYRIVTRITHRRIEPAMRVASVSRIAGLIALFFFVTPILARADQACLFEALTNYSRLKSASLEGSMVAPVLSTETLVGLRRLEEAYCFRVAYCIIGDPREVASRQVPYAASFSKCLRDEALEKYEAEPRKK